MSEQQGPWIAVVDEMDDGSCGCSEYMGVHHSRCTAGYGAFDETALAMINPEDGVDRLYSTGGYPPEWLGDGDPGFYPQWMELSSHLWNQRVNEITHRNMTKKERRDALLSNQEEWLLGWVRETLTKWAETSQFISEE